MQFIPAINDGFWLCKHTWKRSRLNTFWCLLGCSIGDFGTIFTFQMIEHSWSVWHGYDACNNEWTSNEYCSRNNHS
jgi:hypothetical protein